MPLTVFAGFQLMTVGYSSGYGGALCTPRTLYMQSIVLLHKRAQPVDAIGARRMPIIFLPFFFFPSSVSLTDLLYR